MENKALGHGPGPHSRALLSWKAEAEGPMRGSCQEHCPSAQRVIHVDNSRRCCTVAHWYSPALHSWATRFKTSTAAGHCWMNSSQNRLSSKSCAMTRHALNVKRFTIFQSHQCSFFKTSTVKTLQIYHLYFLFFSQQTVFEIYSWPSISMGVWIYGSDHPN